MKVCCVGCCLPLSLRPYAIRSRLPRSSPVLYVENSETVSLSTLTPNNPVDYTVPFNGVFTILPNVGLTFSGISLSALSYYWWLENYDFNGDDCECCDYGHAPFCIQLRQTELRGNSRRPASNFYFNRVEFPSHNTDSFRPRKPGEI